MPNENSRLWVVHIGNHPGIALRAQKEKFICIGWTRMGDLSRFDTREKMKEAMRRAFPEWTDGTIRACYGQVFRFAFEMQPKDFVVYPIKGSREILIGEVSGAYRWAGEDAELRENDYCNIRPVEWLKRVPRIAFSESALHSFGSFSSVSSSDEHIDEVLVVLNKGADDVNQGTSAPRPRATGETPIATRNGSESNPGDVGSPSAPIAIDLADRAIEETKDFLLRQWIRTGQEFEQVVAAVFRAMGYTATVQKGTHDLGVDVVAHPDPLGVQSPLIKIQCKSGTSTIGAPAVKQLRGLLNGPEKGLMVALGGFSNDARHVQQNDADLVLIDGERFVELFLEHYDRIAPEWRHRYPLTRVYVPSG